MDKDQEEIIKFYKEKIEPFMALFVLAFLITGLVLLYQDNQLKKEISENCGYSGEDYECYCEHNYIIEMRSKMQNKSLYVPVSNFNYPEINISNLNLTDEE